MGHNNKDTYWTSHQCKYTKIRCKMILKQFKNDNINYTIIITKKWKYKCTVQSILQICHRYILQQTKYTVILNNSFDIPYTYKMFIQFYDAYLVNGSSWYSKCIVIVEKYIIQKPNHNFLWKIFKK